MRYLDKGQVWACRTDDTGECIFIGRIEQISVNVDCPGETLIHWHDNSHTKLKELKGWIMRYDSDEW